VSGSGDDRDGRAVIAPYGPRRCVTRLRVNAIDEIDIELHHVLRACAGGGKHGQYVSHCLCRLRFDAIKQLARAVSAELSADVYRSSRRGNDTLREGRITGEFFGVQVCCLGRHVPHLMRREKALPGSPERAFPCYYKRLTIEVKVVAASRPDGAHSFLSDTLAGIRRVHDIAITDVDADMGIGLALNGKEHQIAQRR
jgi:phosphotransferase system IIB component